MRLGINIDHIATLRNARGGVHPCPLRAAEVVKAAGAEILTIHLREDRRHIRDADAATLIARQAELLPVNLELAATEEMLAFALKHRPHAVCIVPEKREELTTEGGLDVAGQVVRLADFCRTLNEAGIRTSLFIDPDAAQVSAAAKAGAACVELHTGSYAEAFDAPPPAPPQAVGSLRALQDATKQANQLGLEVHAGHGLTYDNVRDVARIEGIKELNIGHFLVGEALFVGLEQAIRQMREML